MEPIIKKFTPSPVRNLIFLSGLCLSLGACVTDQQTGNASPASSGNYNTNTTVHSYSNKGAYDDNGAEPAPNNGNQNFGRRW
jgi:hypothetical protein